MTPADLARVVAASYSPRRAFGRLLPTHSGDKNTWRCGNRKSAYLLMTDLRKRGLQCDEASVLAALQVHERAGIVARGPGGWAVTDWPALRAAGSQ